MVDSLLLRMLQEQERRRFAPETLERMRARSLAGGQWLDVVNDLQREVAIHFGFSSAVGISAAVHRMRTAHVSQPHLAQVSVYARANLAEDGNLQPGQRWPNVPLWSLNKTVRRLHDWTGEMTVICAGSWT